MEHGPFRFHCDGVEYLILNLKGVRNGNIKISTVSWENGSCDTNYKFEDESSNHREDLPSY